MSDSATLWTIAPLSMGFSRHEYWSGLPFPLPGDLPDPRIKPRSSASSALAGRFFTAEPPGKPSAGGARDSGSIPGSGRSPGRGNGNPLQYSCPGNPHGQRSLVGSSPQGCKDSDMTCRLNIWGTLSIELESIESIYRLESALRTLESANPFL